MENRKSESATCDCNVIHQDKVDKVMEKMPSDRLAYKAADFFKIIGDKTRMKILLALFESELCVCDIAVLLDMNQSAISHQLRVLKQAELVKYRKDGRVVYYSLDDDHVKNILDQGLVHISHDHHKEEAK
ncbi:ArsR/SmtB family transcription factor [Gudongella oleilytica]|jgi:ArsR family transcriptional regulator|uniref:ArsR/SmtB family transcription factor n=1 Tax=Gudongella oleilytica TaxID=1582259 RepID=UPI000EE88CCC|nr:metalloregulator ArsR/SmtB family transcription factor [Gudongella oleilytica]MDY0256730.1 metalloregulator ArsR/SmtB family transcription factor [Gudongella oleilytica]HCO18219.1 transcriptional regulator [Tissierellales bacterium]HMM69105.1 metalloregulator ArsR/SmtB family transcription factor [Gudongella oleilytica]